MIFNRFALFLLLRLLLLFANLLILATIFGRSDLFFNQLILIVVLLIQFFETLFYITRTNRELAKFVLSIREQDFTASFTSGAKDNTFAKLHDSFREILEAIRTSELEKEAQHKYLQAIIDHISIGIISINERDQIELMNEKSKELLQVPHVKSWQLLKTENTRFFDEVSKLRNGDNQVIEAKVNDTRKQLTVNITEVTILKNVYRVITFKDIKGELEKREIEAWHKLIRIWTHEIMNSVTPMVSLTETMQSMLDSNGGLKRPDEITDETIGDLSFSLQTIHGRSEGLLHFVEDYRKLTKVPKPEIEALPVKKMLSRVIKLMQTEFDQAEIDLTILVQDGAIILGDERLLEQVMINLLINARHALESTVDPAIKLMTTENRDGYFAIEITDNGTGIDPDKMDKIFVPFFSTKESGSGIGLSLCQQIMNLHGGFVEVDSEKGEGSTFRLLFPLHQQSSAEGQILSQ